MKVPYTKSGKCGDTVWQRNRHGQVSYPAFVPYNPRTPAQVNGRAIWRTVNLRWRTLTQPQRDRWIAVAETKRSRRRLTDGKLTGQTLFVKINYPQAYLGRPEFDLPPRYPRFLKLAVSSLSVTNVAGVLRISLACPDDPGDHTLLRASAPLSAGRKTCTGFRIIGICPPAVQGSADITALYTARFGVPRIGSKIFLRVNQIIDGWEDEPVEFTFVVLAPQPEPSLNRPSTSVQNRECVSLAPTCASTLSTGSTDMGCVSYMGYTGYIAGRGCGGSTATGTEQGLFSLKTGRGDGGDLPLIPESLHSPSIPSRYHHAWAMLKPP